MEFQSSLDYLYGLQRFGMKLGLDNMRALKERLPLLREPLLCVHVAGTNGKGSVSVTLAEILRHAGLRVGLYTSPHLNCFTERIRIDGVPLPREDVARLAACVREAAGDVPVTFFEATTAMGLLAFRERQVDIAVIETGLGGRLDATNIVEPALCMITPVSIDHSEHLGGSLAAIAAEKAGIIKPGVPLVSGLQEPAAAEVLLTKAGELGAPVTLAGRDFRWTGDHGDLCIEVGAERLSGLRCALPGRHQLDNLAQAVAGALELRTQGLPVTELAIRLAGATVAWPGRLEWMGAEHRLLFDVAHNLAGVESLADYLAAQGHAGIRLVAGLSGERVPAEVLKPLAKLTAAVYAVPVPAGGSVATERIAAWAGECGLPASEYGTAEAGLAAALDDAAATGAVTVVCGSLYLVAELRQTFMEGRVPGALTAPLAC